MSGGRPDRAAEGLGWHLECRTYTNNCILKAIFDLYHISVTTFFTYGETKTRTGVSPEKCSVFEQPTTHGLIRNTNFEQDLTDSDPFSHNH